eukprot:gene18698-22538_t
MKTAAGSNKKGYGSYESVSKSEQMLLDDLEASTRSIYSKAKIINTEAQEQQHLIDSVGDNFDKAHSGLRSETSHIHETRKEGDELCWMYIKVGGVILTCKYHNICCSKIQRRIKLLREI